MEKIKCTVCIVNRTMAKKGKWREYQFFNVEGKTTSGDTFYGVGVVWI